MTQQTWGQPQQQVQPGGWGQPPQGHYAAQQPQQGFPAQQQQGNPWGGGQQAQAAPQGPAPIAAVAGDEFDDFFSGGVKGEPGFDWGRTQNAGKALQGANIAGIITDMVQMQQTDFATRDAKFYPDGQPMMQVAITLQTGLRNWEGIIPDQIPVDTNTGQPKHPSEDQGLRRIYVKNDMKRAVTVACMKVGQKPRKGGKLAVQLSGFEDRGKGNPLPLYEAIYEKAPEDGGTGGFFQQPAQQLAQQAEPGPTMAATSMGVGQPATAQATQPPAPAQQPVYDQPQGQGYATPPQQQPQPSTLGNGAAPTQPPAWATEQPPAQQGPPAGQALQYEAPSF